MFQEMSEKGLFTFYWEETHKQKKEHHLTHRSQFVEPVQLFMSKDDGIEEKLARKNHHKTEKHETPLSRHESYLYFNFDKQTKSVLVPHTVTLAPTITHSKQKNSRKQHKATHFKESHQQKQFEKQRKEKEIGQNAVEKLLFSDETLECRKKNLEIQQNQVVTKSNCLSTLRPPKIRKATLKDAQSNNGLRSSQNFPAINLQSQSSSQTCRLPQLFAAKCSHKKLKRLKENYLLQKIWMEKGKEKHSSVVNIGINSVDDYKQRWQKKKTEFLALLSRSLADRQ